MCCITSFVKDILSKDKESYLLRECEDSHVYLWVMDEGLKMRIGFYDSFILKDYYPTEMHEKVFLRDILSYLEGVCNE